MLYLDTSLLVAVLTNETETERMQRWLGQQRADDLAISDWVATEFSSALSIKLRTGQIEASHRADALATFTRLATDSFTVVPVSRLQFRTAARFVEQQVKTPVVAYIAGFSAPPGKTMGHAGAIISGSSGTAQGKKDALEAAGIQVGTTPTEVAQLVADRFAART